MFARDDIIIHDLFRNKTFDTYEESVDFLRAEIWQSYKLPYLVRM